MSKANRKKVYEDCKDNKKNHLLDDVLRAEFDPDSVTETEEEREAKAKEIAEKKLKELKEVETPGAAE